MDIVKTRSFKLATYRKGEISSSKLALVLPGRLDTKDYPHIKSHVDYLATRGFYAVSFDPPGTWESPGGIEIYTMTNYLKAVDELIEYFGNKPTFIMGHSRGSSISIFSAIKNSHIKMFLSVFPTYAYTPEVHGGYPNHDWKKTGYSLHERELPNDRTKKTSFKLPYAFLEDQIQYDASEGLRVCIKPKLFVYGESDTTVEPVLVKTAYNMSAEPKEIVALKSNHDYRYKPDLINEVNGIVGRFLDKYWTD